MQKMILVPVEQYYRMIESYDKAMEELHEVRSCKGHEDPGR
ncbi:hypothetical protein [Lacrimispora sp.]|nr:hypothetical protein [Lacrimispora sp.]